MEAKEVISQFLIWLENEKEIVLCKEYDEAISIDEQENFIKEYTEQFE